MSSTDFINVTPDGGIQKKIITEGNGETPTKGSNVRAHYVGTLANGKVFDSSRSRNEEFVFPIGTGRVIKGWDIGIATMKVGEKCILRCKPAYAYGSREIGPIPANSTLDFEVELMGFGPAEKSRGLFFWAAVPLAIVYMFFMVYLSRIVRVDIPPHLHNHSVIYATDFISKSQAVKLRTLVKDFKRYPSNINADTKTLGFKPLHVDIGEGQPLTASGKCEHDFLVPNLDKTSCILPQRIDVGRHFVITGGIDAVRERKERMVTRVSSFGKYFMGNIDQFPVVKELFDSDGFQAAAKQTCPQDSQVLDPFQFNVIIQIPGQTVALHIDAPYFWGASRYQFPQWLLAAMVFSNLFQDRFIHQVQIVGYVHERNYNKSDGGDFAYYSDNSGKYYSVPSVPLSASAVDGSKTVHAANIYQPNADIPQLDKDKDADLVFVDGDDWELQVDGKKVKAYKWNDLRVSIVYRARCFKDDDELKKYTETYNKPDDNMTLDYILDVFRKDLISRNVVSVDANGLDGFQDGNKRLELAMLIMDTYVKYPYPPKEAAVNPYNYGLLANAFS